MGMKAGFFDAQQGVSASTTTPGNTVIPSRVASSAGRMDPWLQQPQQMATPVHVFHDGLNLFRPQRCLRPGDHQSGGRVGIWVSGRQIERLWLNADLFQFSAKCAQIVIGHAQRFALTVARRETARPEPAGDRDDTKLGQCLFTELLELFPRPRYSRYSSPSAVIPSPASDPVVDRG